MSVIKIAHRETNYLVVQKDCLNERSLTWGARGLHAYLMGKPVDWRVMIRELINSSPHGKHAIYGYLNELIGAGYIKRVRETENGRVKQYAYYVYEVSQVSKNQANSPLPKNQKVEATPLSKNQEAENQDPEKQPLLNINNTNQVKNKAAESAVAFSEFIGEQLTAQQESQVANRLDEAKLSFGAFSQAEWLTAIKGELVDSHSFKKAEQFFSHKLNIIMQQAKVKKWSPALHQVKVEKALDDKNA
jgi:hypothetical protein